MRNTNKPLRRASVLLSIRQYEGEAIHITLDTRVNDEEWKGQYARRCSPSAFVWVAENVLPDLLRDALPRALEDGWGDAIWQTTFDVGGAEQTS